jgi:microcystin-dependent protein
MSDQFVAEIRIVASNFAPTGWAFCNGQVMPIAQNTALFSLIENRYGGDGVSTFALPNLQNRVPIGHGQGQGLSNRQLAESGGQAAVTLTTDQLPAHNHGTLKVHDAPGTSGTPSATRSLARSSQNVYGPAASLVPMGDAVGGGQAHNNQQPYLRLNFIIALQGIFPSRPPQQV